MDCHTFTVTLAAERSAVFDYLSRPAHLSEWAPELCADANVNDLFVQGVSPGGTDVFTLIADRRTGVIDLLFGPKPDELIAVPLRVVQHGAGCAVLCSALRPAHWSARLFERYLAALCGGLAGLRRRFGPGEIAGMPSAGDAAHVSLVTERFNDSWQFYTESLGFRTVCESDTYVHLEHPSGARLGLLRAELDGPPRELVTAVEGRGFWLTLAVPDADAAYGRLAQAGADIVDGIEDKPWGQRQFVVRDPNGVLIALAQPLPTAREALSPLAVAS